MSTIYGIKNCDTMKKAFKWLDENGVKYSFHDYKKSGVDENILRTTIETHGWEKVINQRGTTWRKLPEEIKTSVDSESAVQIALENPSIVKRPLLEHNGQTYLGFKDSEYEEIFRK